MRRPRRSPKKRKISAWFLRDWRGTANCHFALRSREDFFARRDWRFSRSLSAAGRPLGEPELVTLAYDLYAPALSADLSVNIDGLQFMLDEDKQSGLVDAKFTLDRVVNDRLLKAAQQELRAEARLK